MLGNTKAVYTWPVTELKKLKNTMIYVCVMGKEEKKVACNITGIPQRIGTEIIIDWSESSRMQVPATFSSMEEQPGQIVKRMEESSESEGESEQ